MPPFESAASNGTGKLKRSKRPTESLRPAKRSRKTSDAPNPKSSPKLEQVKPIPQVRPAQVSVLRQEEKAFPRGGAGVLSPLEYKQIQVQAKQDVLFEEANRKRGVDTVGLGSDEEEERSTPLARKLKKRSGDSKRRKKEAEAEEEKEERVKIEGLSYKSLVPGSLVLGKVSHITSRDVSLALPNNLTGFIPITAISEQLTKRIERLLDEEEHPDDVRDDLEQSDIELHKLFSMGQYLRAYVISTEDETSSGQNKGKRRIELSLSPRLVNNDLQRENILENNTIQASVASVEDHGLIMDMGLEDTSLRGFMSSNELGRHAKLATVQEGAVFLCRITGLSANGKIVKLSADDEKNGNPKKMKVLKEAPTIDAFLPGTPVELLVTETSSSALIGNIMGTLDATADIVHSGAGDSKKNLADLCKTGAKVKARIICTFPKADKARVGVSILDHIVHLSSRTSREGKAHRDPLEVLRLSSTVEEAEVIKVESGRGLFLSLGVKGVPGYAHISKLSDKKIEELSSTEGRFKIGSKHRARVVGYNSMDGLYIVSLEQSVLDQLCLRIDDLHIGQKVKGTITKLITNDKGVSGLLVGVSDGVVGLVPEMHMADVHLEHPERKFKDGMKVTARVLSTDPDKRQFRLTLKKTLINSDADIWSDYHCISPGASSPGTIINIQQSGAVVQFYGPVRGFLPIAEMSESFVDNPFKHFRVGQVVSVHVLSVDAENQKLMISCKDPSSFGPEQLEAYEALRIGSVVNGTVTEVSSDAIKLDVGEHRTKALLPLSQLTDGSDQKNMSFLKRTRVGQKMNDLVLLKKSTKRVLTLSNKPSLVKAALSGKLPTTLDDLKRGQEVQGYVGDVTHYGVFVQFGGDLAGLLLRNQVADDHSKLPDFGFQKGSSITTKVLSIDHEQNQFLLTMKDVFDKPEKTQHKPIVTDADELMNPIDESCKTVADLTIGRVTKAVITSIKATQLNVRLADNTQGRIDVSEVFETWEDIKNRKQPLQQFRQKQTVTVRVLGIHDAKNHRYLPISHRAGKNSVFELSAKVGDPNSEEFEVLSMEKLTNGSSWIAFVNNLSDNCIWVNITPNIRGRVALLDVSNDMNKLENIENDYPVGSAMRVWVKNVNIADNRLDLSARSSDSDDAITLDTISKGMVLPARVTKITERSAIVQLNESLSGSIPLTELADDFSQANLANRSKNEIIRVAVVDVDRPNKRVILSCRPSKVLSSSLPVKDPSFSSLSQLKVNDVYRGFVKNVAEKGLFISLSHKITAFVRISDLSDSFIKDWRSAFQVDQLVKGKIIMVDADLNHVQMSLKESVLDKDYTPPIKFSDVHPGQVVVGKVRKVVDYGLFIIVDNSDNVSGLCHRSQIADRKIEDIAKLYEEGDVVKAKVLKVQPEKRRVSFGLKASYFEDAKEEDESSDEDMEDGGVVLDQQASDDDAAAGLEDVDMENVQSMDSASEVDEGLTGAANINDGDESDNASHVNALETSGFDWTGGSTLDLLNNHTLSGGDSQSDDEEEAGTKRKKRRRKPEIKVDRTGDLDKHGPRSVADFERQLLGQPNSSLLWVQYMAFQLQLSEIDKARAIAERALKTIHLADEDERLNVWVAWLNLENAFGTDESLEEVFSQARRGANEEEIHKRLASIYVDSEKLDKADDLYAKMTKLPLLSRDPSFWLSYATFLLTKRADPSRARALLSRATQSVRESEHRHLTVRFAELEFRSPNGDAERGRTIFEGLLATWPRKWDVWNAYLGVEKGKRGEKGNVAKLYERIVEVEGKDGKKKWMGKEKARDVFDQWLKWEERNGGAKSAERVKERARVYVEELKRERDEAGRV